jgi:iron complex outermembrane recepter protein
VLAKRFFLCLACASAPAFGQADAEPLPAEAPASAPPKPAQVTQLEPVVITGNGRSTTYQSSRAKAATKTDTPLVDTPQAIVVVPRAVLQDQGARDLHDAARNVSGVSRQASYWGQNTGTFRVRGFDLDEGAGYLRDGFRYFARGSVFMPNVQSVEILKGPASVLYGRVEPGGLANIVSEAPSRRASRSLQVSAGRYDQYVITGSSTAALDEAQNWLYRVDAELEDSQSFRDQVYSKRLGVAPQLTWQIDAQTKLRAYVEYQWQDTLTDYGIPGWQGRPADVPIHWYYGEPFNRQISQQLRTTLSLERRLDDTWTLRAALLAGGHRYASGNNEAYSASVGDFGPGGDGPSDGIPRVYRFWGEFPERHVRNDAQAELLGKPTWLGVPHTLLLGAEAGWHADRTPSSRSSSYPALEIFNPVPIGVYVPQADIETSTFENRDRIQALYVQDEIELTERLRLLLGARYDRYTQRYAFSSSDGTDQRATTRDDSVSPRAGLLFKLGPQASVYASASRSFAPASGFFAAEQGREFKPLIGTQQEVGAKWDSDDGRLVASVAVYDLRKRNVVTQDPDDPRFSIQIGEERSTGVEIDLAAQPWPGVNLIASFARMNARIAQSTDFAEGNVLPFAPRLSGSLWVTWRLPPALVGMEGWHVGAGAFAQGTRAGDLENTVFLPHYIRWDASVGWHDDHWQAQLSVENLTNRRYYDSGTGFGAGVIYPGAPRSATFSLRYAW